MHAFVISGFTFCMSLFGLLECFWGYRIFKIILRIFGFLVGAVLGSALGMGLTNGNEVAALFAGLLGGIICALLILPLRFIGVFLVGAFLGLLAGSLLGIVGLEPNLIILLILAVGGGVLCLFLDKLMIIVATSFGGAWLAVFGLTSLFLAHGGGIFAMLPGSGAPKTAGVLLVVLHLAWLALGVVGILGQYEIIPVTQYIERLPVVEELKQRFSPKKKSEDSGQTPESEKNDDNDNNLK